MADTYWAFTEAAREPRLNGQRAWVRWAWLTFLVLAERSPQPGVLLKPDGSARNMANLQAACQVDRLHPALEHFLRVGLLADTPAGYAVVDWSKRPTHAVEGGEGETTEGVREKDVAPQSTELVLSVQTVDQPKPIEPSGSGGATAPQRKRSKKVDPLESAEHMALVDALGTAFNANAPREWDRCVAAAVLLRRCRPPVGPEEVPLLKAAWPLVYPEASCTPTAIANHVGALRAAEGPHRPNGRGPKETPREQAMRRMKEKGSD